MHAMYYFDDRFRALAYKACKELNDSINIYYVYNENIMINAIELRFWASDLDSIDPCATRYTYER